MMLAKPGFPQKVSSFLSKERGEETYGFLGGKFPSQIFLRLWLSKKIQGKVSKSFLVSFQETRKVKVSYRNVVIPSSRYPGEVDRIA